MQAIEIKNLVKKYGGTFAADHVSFSVEQGQIFALLGPNGAGKTTTLEIVEGLRSPDSGETLVLGIDTQKEISKVKEKIGIELQQSSFFDYLTLEEILSLYGSFYKKSISAEELLKKFDLTDKKDAYVKHLSGGQKQRFSIALSLVNDPEILFLDEPTTGIDPQSRHYLWEMIKGINKEGKTIVLTTHYMEEAEILCDKVAIIDDGKIIARDTPIALIAASGIPYKVTVSLAGNPDFIKNIEKVMSFHKVKKEGEYQFKIGKIEDLQDAIRKFEKGGVKINNLEVRSANLEDVFLQLTGKELRE